VTLSAANSPSANATTNMTSGQCGQRLEPGPKTVQRQIVEPYATLGQLSYAPATHTTVVTTTTTTTTSFPPILLSAPRSLKERDPKVYPLASSPAPESIRRFCFDVAGTQARFSEADNVEQSLQEV
jgi:F-box and WD-40 domain protein CDC4